MGTAKWYRDTSKDQYASVLYAWVSFYGDDYIYTTTLTPNESTFLYPGEGTTYTEHSFAGFTEAESILSLNVVRNASSGVTEPEVRYDRASDKDIILSSTLYTDSTTLTVGATLYNNLGEDSGMKIGTVTSEGSFKVESNMYTLTINCTTGLGIYANDFVVTEVETGTILYTADDLAPPATITIDFPKTSTIKITNLMSGTVTLSGSGCWGLSVTNCSETHDSVSNNGNSYDGYYNNVVLSNFTGNPTVDLDFGYGKP